MKSVKGSSAHLVIYLRRQSLVVAVPSRKELITIELDETLVKDLDVVSLDGYRKAITKAIAQQKIEKGLTLIVLATEVCFVMLVPEQPKKTTKNEAEDSRLPVNDITDRPGPKLLREMKVALPFVNSYARLFTRGKQDIVVGLNRSLYEPLLMTLKELGFEVTTLVAEPVLDVSLEQGFTREIGLALAADIANLENHDLLEAPDKPRGIITTTTPQTPEEKKRTFLLAGVFIILLGLLGLVYWYVNRPSSEPLPAVVPVVEPVQSSPVVEDVLEDEIFDESASDSGELDLLLDETGSTATRSGATNPSAAPSATTGARAQTTPNTTPNVGTVSSPTPAVRVVTP